MTRSNLRYLLDEIVFRSSSHPPVRFLRGLPEEMSARAEQWSKQFLGIEIVVLLRHRIYSPCVSRMTTTAALTEKVPISSDSYT